jgi:hypothetical protein
MDNHAQYKQGALVKNTLKNERYYGLGTILATHICANNIFHIWVLWYKRKFPMSHTLEELELVNG